MLGVSWGCGCSHQAETGLDSEPPLPATSRPSLPRLHSLPPWSELHREMPLPQRRRGVQDPRGPERCSPLQSGPACTTLCPALPWPTSPVFSPFPPSTTSSLQQHSTAPTARLCLCDVLSSTDQAGAARRHGRWVLLVGSTQSQQHSTHTISWRTAGLSPLRTVLLFPEQKNK